MKQFKKVFCSVVDFQGLRSFEEILMDIDLRYVLPFRNKQVELSHVVEEADFITGLFVATQTKDIAPIHTPGDEEDYSAVVMGEGQGFAYPNVFLYIKASKVLMWEVNRMGVLESVMEYYFNTISAQYANSSFNVTLAPIMNLEASLRLDRLIEMDSVELQIAQPTEFLRQEANRDGAMGDIFNVVNNTNATKSISIKLVAEKEGLNKLNINSIRTLVSNFLRLPHIDHGRTKNKLVVVGKSRDENNLIEETINFVTDRLTGRFSIEKLVIAQHLQIPDRRSEIKNVYLELINFIRQLIRVR